MPNFIRQPLQPLYQAVSTQMDGGISPNGVKLALDQYLPQKVNIAAVLPKAGDTSAPRLYNTPSAAAAAAVTGETIAIRGVVTANLTVTQSGTLDGDGMQMGQCTLGLGVYPGTAAAFNYTVRGGASQGRIAIHAQKTTASNVITLKDFTLTEGSYIDLFANYNGATDNQAAVDTLILDNVRVYKTASNDGATGGAATNTGNLGLAAIRFQSRTDSHERVLKIIVRGNCHLESSVGPIFGGYAAEGSNILLEGDCVLLPGAGFALQTVQDLPVGGQYSDAVLLTDNRDVEVDIEGVPDALHDAVIAGSFDAATNELTGAQPAGSLPQMEFGNGLYLYKYMRSSTGANQPSGYTWRRI